MRMRRGIAAASVILLTGAAPVAQSATAPRAAQRGDVAAIRYTGTLIQGGLIRGTVPLGTVTLTLDGAPVGIAGGRFIAGFDRDAGGIAVLAATMADGRRVTEMLAIAPRDWAISRLSSLPKYPVPSAEFQRLRPEEIKQIVAARATSNVTDGWRQDFVWPVKGRISTTFGSQRIYQNGEAGSYHSGIDIARATGTPVVAPADGVVILAAASPFTLEGNLLMIDHGMGLNSAFLHLSRIDVKTGDRVRQGQLIGAVGKSGRATGPHLHWSLRWHDAKLDPLLVAGAMN